MSAATNSENRATRASATVVSKSDLLNQALDEIFAELPTRDDPPASPPLKPVVPHCEPAATLPAQRVAYSVYPLTRVAAKRYAETNWFYRTKHAIYVGLMLIGAALIFQGTPSSWRASINPFSSSQASPASATPTAHSTGDRRVRTQRIDQIRVGDRVVGRNPVREQADLVEPDPATWRKISLHMTKESGLGLCIDLLRPLPWIDEHNATPGSTIFIDLIHVLACPRSHRIGQPKVFTSTSMASKLRFVPAMTHRSSSRKCSALPKMLRSSQLSGVWSVMSQTQMSSDSCLISRAAHAITWAAWVATWRPQERGNLLS